MYWGPTQKRIYAYRWMKRFGFFNRLLNQSQSGIYIETGLGSAANTVFPAKAGIQGTVQHVLSWAPAYAGETKSFAPSGCAN